MLVILSQLYYGHGHDANTFAKKGEAIMEKVLPRWTVVIIGIILFALLIAVREEIDNSLLRTAVAACAGCILALAIWYRRQ